MTWALDDRPVRSVLLTRLRYLGDIVMSTVLIEALLRGDPDLRIGYLCEDSYASVLEGHPGIDRLHRLGVTRVSDDAKARPDSSVAASTSRSTPGMIQELRRTSYDLAVDLFFNPRSAWLLRLAGIPQRIGGTRKWRGRLYTHRVLRNEVAHEHPEFNRIAPGGLGEHLCRLAPLEHVESGEGFVTWLSDRFDQGELMPRLDLPAGARSAREIVTGYPYLLLAPCATWPSKEWPLESWKILLSLLVDRTELSLAVLVAPGRESVASELAGLIPAHRGGVLPVLPLHEALTVTAAARALISVDGGIMHASVGLGVPTLALFGPTDADIWFPYPQSGDYRVLVRAPKCHPCDLHECPDFICLPELQPQAVLETLEAMLADRAEPSGETT